jgi:hypothetical protein
LQSNEKYYDDFVKGAQLVSRLTSDRDELVVAEVGMNKRLQPNFDSKTIIDVRIGLKYL